MSYQYDTVPRAVEQPESEFSAREVSHYPTRGSTAVDALPSEFDLLSTLVQELKRAHEERDFVRFSQLAATMSNELQAMILSLELDAVAPLLVRMNNRIAPFDKGIALSLESALAGRSR